MYGTLRKTRAKRNRDARGLVAKKERGGAVSRHRPTGDGENDVITSAAQLESRPVRTAAMTSRSRNSRRERLMMMAMAKYVQHVSRRFGNGL